MLPLEPTPYSKDYEITDAMFGAFRSPGGMPFFWKLFGWSTLLLTLVGLVVIPPSIELYFDLIKGSVMVDSNPEMASQFFVTLGKFFALIIVYMVVYAAVLGIMRAAFFRTYFFGEDDRTIPLKFGADEWRQMVSMLGFYVLLIIVIIGPTLIAMLPITLLTVVLGDESIGLIILGVILSYLAAIAAYIWFGVRFCCAGALTARRRHIHVIAARYVSRNRFWPIFGAILVAGVIGYAVYYILMTFGIMIAFAGLMDGEFMTMVASTDPAAKMEFFDRVSQSTSFGLTSVVAITLVSAGYAFYSLMLAGPEAYFTQQWAEAGGAPVEETVV